MQKNISPHLSSKNGLVSVNGKNIYYEVYGKGKPLFLLHGYTQSSVSWKSYIKDYENSDEHIRAIMHQFKNYIVKLSDKELQSIQPEVLLMIEDDEGMSLNEIVRARQNLPNSDLWILPNVSHGAHEGENKEGFIKKSKVFLNKT